MGIGQGDYSKSRAGLRGKVGRHYKFKRPRQKPQGNPIADPKTIEIATRLRQTLAGPLWFYTRPQESDE